MSPPVFGFACQLTKATVLTPLPSIGLEPRSPAGLVYRVFGMARLSPHVPPWTRPQRRDNRLGRAGCGRAARVEVRCPGICRRTRSRSQVSHFPASGHYGCGRFSRAPADGDCRRCQSGASRVICAASEAGNDYIGLTLFRFRNLAYRLFFPKFLSGKHEPI